MTKQEEIREGQAELEHEQWIKWSQAIAPEVSKERQDRWAKLWIPYSDLTEEQKDQDRVWADKSLNKLHSQGVVIKVDREVPLSPYVNPTTDYQRGFNQALNAVAGYEAVEPLIKEGK